MPAWIGPAIAAGSSLLGGLLGGSAQKKANQQNIALNRENRDWEERMSNTSWQRGVQDMLKAGMNPMLAYSQGGASTPQSSAATVNQVDAPAKGISSAGDKFMQVQQLENMRLQNQILVEKRDQEHVNTRVMQDKYPITESGGPAELTQAEINRVIADAKAAVAKADIANIERRIAQNTEGYNVQSAKARADLASREVSIGEARELIMRLDIPEKEAIAKWFSTVGAASPAAKAVMSIGQWLKFILGR